MSSGRNIRRGGSVAHNLWIYLCACFFFLFGSPFANIHNSQDSRGKERLFTSNRFTHIFTLAGRLLQRAHLCIQLTAGLEPGTFGFRGQVVNHLSHTAFVAWKQGSLIPYFINYRYLNWMYEDAGITQWK